MRAAIRKLVLILALQTGLMVCFSDAQAQKSITGQQDISALLAAAQESFDLSRQDAILLLDSRKVQWLPDGRLVTSIHRIIRVNTSLAVRAYGDHRIPYDESRCIFNVQTVRTWRDGEWWETGPTGIVETLPYQVREAYDYANVREMMLLHNGIELPCILEVAYSIEDKVAFRGGAEGLWTFAREEPVVQSMFSLGLPSGWKLNVSVSEDVSEPEMKTDTNRGLDVYIWKMGPLEAIGRPHMNDPAAYVPYIAWSTWTSWSEYGNHLENTFESAIKLDTSLAKQLDSVLEKSRTDGEKADLIAKFINERTRFIDYPEHYWWSSPRVALRTYVTAYGHRLDRAVLAAALLGKAGIKAQPVFLGRGYGSVDERVPTLARMLGIGVWLTGDNLDAYYDPQHGTVSDGPARVYNRTVWFPGFDDKPRVRLGGKTEQSLMDIRIDLAFDKEKDMFTGNGYLYADNSLNPYDRMEGLAGEAKAYLGSIASSMIKGAKVTGFNPSRFDRTAVIVGFEIELKKPEPDDLGRISLVVGEPSSGISGRLTGDVHAFDRSRSSPVYLPCVMSQKVEFTLDLKGLELVYHPEERTEANDAGHFSLTVDENDDRIIITRRLNLAKTDYQPEGWPALRTLLLADRHERSQTLLLKTVEIAKDNEDEKETAEK